MKLRNDLITEEANKLVDDAIAELEKNNCAGIADRLERNLRREHEYFKHLIQIAETDFERREELRVGYSEIMVPEFIKVAKQEAAL